MIDGPKKADPPSNVEDSIEVGCFRITQPQSRGEFILDDWVVEKFDTLLILEELNALLVDGRIRPFW